MLPRITPFYFEDNPVHSGRFVEVSCTVSEGDLPITFEWRLNGNKLEDFLEISVSSVGKRTSFLSIEAVSYTHAGNYTCAAKNKAGETFFSSELQVNGYLEFIHFVLILLTSLFISTTPYISPTFFSTNDIFKCIIMSQNY